MEAADRGLATAGAGAHRGAMARDRFDFEDMEVFRRALELVEAVDDFVRPLRGYRRALASQMFRSASSVAQNVAESTGRNGYRDRARFLDIANGSARETGAGVTIADRLDIGTPEDRRHLRKLLTELISILTTNARLLRERSQTPR